MTPSTSRRTPLDRARIVEAATALADEEGVDALSMRQVAKRLSCGAMSLYNHVANKDELLSLMVDAVATDIPEPPDDLAPLDAIRAIAVATRDAFVAHPWAPQIWQRYLPGPGRSRGMDDLLRLFAESGLAPELAHHGFHAVTNHVLGYTLQAMSMSMGDGDLESTARGYLAGIDADRYPHMVAHVHQHLDGQTASSFELVLDLILDGLVRLDADDAADAAAPSDPTDAADAAVPSDPAEHPDTTRRPHPG